VNNNKNNNIYDEIYNNNNNNNNNNNINNNINYNNNNNNNDNDEVEKKFEDLLSSVSDTNKIKKIIKNMWNSNPEELLLVEENNVDYFDGKLIIFYVFFLGLDFLGLTKIQCNYYD
jgi:uncharacterized membrane-anchored protein YjiN (DUF445 family)